jgi:hypothetical protein
VNLANAAALKGDQNSLANQSIHTIRSGKKSLTKSAISRVFSNTLSKSAVKSNLHRDRGNEQSITQKKSIFSQQSFDNLQGNLYAATTDNRVNNPIENNSVNNHVQLEK